MLPLLIVLCDAVWCFGAATVAGMVAIAIYSESRLPG